MKPYFFFQPVGWCSSRFHLSCQCFCSSVSSSESRTWKCKSETVLVFFFVFLSLFCWFIFREIWISFRGLQSMHQSVYWRFKDRKTRATKHSDEENSCISQSQRSLWMGELVCVWLQTRQTATRGPSSRDTHMIPPSYVIVTCHRTFGGFRCFWEFSAFSIGMELLLAFQTNYRGRRTLRSSVLHRLGLLARRWGDEWWTWNWREEQKTRKERAQLGFCDVAQRNMAGYDVWRLRKKKDKIP